MLDSLIAWHRQYLNDLKKKQGWSVYKMYVMCGLAGMVKGIVLMLILYISF